MAGGWTAGTDHGFEVVNDSQARVPWEVKGALWIKAYQFIRKLVKAKIFYCAAGRALLFNKERRTLINQQPVEQWRLMSSWPLRCRR